MTFFGRSEPVPEGSTAIPLSCDYCKVKVSILLPASIGTLAALARAFEDHHAECALDRKDISG